MKLEQKRVDYIKLYSRNQFAIYKDIFIEANEVPPLQISLRKVAKNLSNFDSQGYGRYTLCKTNREKCKV